MAIESDTYDYFQVHVTQIMRQELEMKPALFVAANDTHLPNRTGCAEQIRA
jgi:hypothetical protein